MKRERLERALTAPLRRRAVLGTIFWAMPKAVSRRALAKERLVVTWRITGRRDGRADLRQLVIEDGAAAVLDGEPREPDLELEDGRRRLRSARHRQRVAPGDVPA